MIQNKICPFYLNNLAQNGNIFEQSRNRVASGSRTDRRSIHCHQDSVSISGLSPFWTDFILMFSVVAGSSEAENVLL